MCTCGGKKVTSHSTLQFCRTTRRRSRETTKVSSTFPSSIFFLHTVLTYHFDFTGGAKERWESQKKGKKRKLKSSRCKTIYWNFSTSQLSTNGQVTFFKLVFSSILQDSVKVFFHLLNKADWISFSTNCNSEMLMPTLLLNRWLWCKENIVQNDPFYVSFFPMEDFCKVSSFHL